MCVNVRYKLLKPERLTGVERFRKWVVNVYGNGMGLGQTRPFSR